MAAKKKEEERSFGQVLLDRWLWLFLGSILISALSYNAWGLYELFTLPAGK